jgi:hypothetical protein
VIRKNRIREKAPAKRSSKRPSGVLPEISVAGSPTPAGIITASKATAPGGSLNVLLLGVMILAIFCFAIAAIPWALLPSRAAYFVVERQIDLTLLGFIFLVAAGFTYVWTRGP